MSTKRIEETQRPVANTAAQLDADQHSLTRLVGVFDGMALRRQDSKNARLALSVLGEAKIRSQTNVALTALALGEAKLRSALVASTVGEIGALTVAVNHQTASVVLGLTNAASAEMLTHLENRRQNDALLHKSLQTGGLTAEEYQQYSSVLQVMADADIERGLRRSQSAKDAVDALAAHATAGIASTKDRLL